MGLAGSIFTYVQKTSLEWQERHQRIYENAERMSDEELIRKALQAHHPAEKSAYLDIARSRGLCK